MSGPKTGDLVDIRSAPSYRPDVQALARGRLAQARREAGLSSGEFAETLTAMLGWQVTPQLVDAWETNRRATRQRPPRRRPRHTFGGGRGSRRSRTAWECPPRRRACGVLVGERGWWRPVIIISQWARRA